MDLSKKKLLIVAPHPDDEVIGCGGLISKIKSLGGKVFIIYLTVGTTKDFSKKGVSTGDERIGEIKKVARFLNIDDWRIAFEGDEYHLKLDQLSQLEIITQIEKGERISLEKTRPDIIAFPWKGDYNQDHRTASTAAFSACRPSPKASKFIPDVILSYEEPMYQWTQSGGFVPNFFVTLSRKNINDKIKAMSLYTSQKRGDGFLRGPRSLESLAALRGATVGTDFAEAYYSYKIQVN